MCTARRYEYFAIRNKRPIGHIAHLRKQFKSISTYDYIITLIKRGKISHNLLFENWMVVYLNKLESCSPKDAMCQVWLKLTQWFWRRLKCEKFTTTTTMMTDNGQILIRKTHLRLWLRWAIKVNLYFFQWHMHKVTDQKN